LPGGIRNSVGYPGTEGKSTGNDWQGFADFYGRERPANINR
jgi:hypothetical protein